MKISVNSPKAVLSNGMGCYELFLGIDTYQAVRTGDAVEITANDGTVEATVGSVAIGPLGQFLGQGVSHVSNVGRANDVRTVVDAVEARYPIKTKGNEKALDPRTVYTAVFFNVPYVMPTPVAPVPVGTYPSA